MIQIRQEWLVGVGCVRGRICEAPEDWGRDLFLTPPSAAEFPTDISEEFNLGKPLPFRFEDGNVIFVQ